jgi:hypothetical protein
MRTIHVVGAAGESEYNNPMQADHSAMLVCCHLLTEKTNFNYTIVCYDPMYVSDKTVDT